MGGKSKAIDVSNRRQMFIDHRFIARCDGVELNVNPPMLHRPVVTAERPWEAGWMHYACLVQESNALKLWYGCHPPSEDGELGPEYFCYATSGDGVEWERPSLGLVEYMGSKDNNILPLSGSMVFIDPKAPPHQRFKMLRCKTSEDLEQAGLYIAYSADGIHWKEHPQRVLPHLPDTQNQVFYDSHLGKYVAYLRSWAPLRKVVRAQMDDVLQPWPYDQSFKPVKPWGEKYPPVPTHELPTAISYDQLDPPETDIYTPAVSVYPWAQDVYLAFPSIYCHFPDPPKGRWRNDGLLEIQLAVSRDGMSFKRPDRRRAYIPLGLRGEPQGGSLYMVPGLARMGDEVYHYYVAYAHSHGEYVGFRELRGIGAIYLAVQRLDGFISADAAYTGGWLETPPIIFSGCRLELNLDCGATGHTLVELLDAGCTPIEGFTAEEADPIRGNHLHYTVTWQGRNDVSRLAGRVIRLRFTMRNAKLYAFQFLP